MHRPPASGVARTLTRTGLGLAGVLSISIAAAALEGSTGADRTSPWTPPVLDVGVDLSGVTLPVSARPAPVQSVPIGPQAAPTAAASADDHDHDGDGVQDHAPGAHPAADGGDLRVVDGDSHDFGSLVQGAVVEHTFTVESVGEAPLVVTSVKASCGCTVATSERIAADGSASSYAFGQEVAPGERLRITARLNTDGKKNRMQSTLTVFSNAPASTTMLRLSADVQPFFELAPNPYIQFGKLFSNETKTEMLRVSSPIAGNFRLTLADATQLPEHLQVELRPNDPDAEGRAASWDVVATIGPNAPESPSQNWPLRLESDVPVDGAPALPDGSVKRHSVTAYTVAQVVGLVSANPYYVSFGLVRPGQELERSVMIEVADDDFSATAMPVTVRGRQDSDSALLEGRLTAQVAPVAGEPRKYALSISLADLPDSFNGPFGGYLDIEVGHETKPTLTIPFSGVVRNTEVRPAPPVPTPGAGGGR